MLFVFDNAFVVSIKHIKQRQFIITCEIRKNFLDLALIMKEKWQRQEINGLCENSTLSALALRADGGTRMGN